MTQVHDFCLSITIIKRVYQYNNVEQDNEMKKFIHFCKQYGKHFTDQMLKYESVDKNMMIYFYNISMHIFSNYSY